MSSEISKNSSEQTNETKTNLVGTFLEQIAKRSNDSSLDNVIDSSDATGLSEKQQKLVESILAIGGENYNFLQKGETLPLEKLQKIANEIARVNEKYGQVISDITSFKTELKTETSYSSYINGLNERIEIINNGVKENTTFIGKVGDILSSDSGGKAIYENQMLQALEESQSKYLQFKKDVKSGLITNQETINSINNSFIAIFKNAKVKDIGFLDASITSVKNISIENTINDGKNAIAGVKGTAEGVYNVGKSTIVGAFTLAEGMGKYALSGWGSIFEFFGVPKEILENTIIDPAYKDKINSQFNKISEYLEKNGISGVSEEIGKAISQEFKKIGELRGEEQAQAIGNLSGNIIGMLALVKGGMALASKTASLASKGEKAGELIGKVGANTARAEKLAQISTKIERAKTILKLVDIVTNGVGESLIGFALSKAISGSISLLKIGTGLTIDQLKQVKTTIAKLKEARKTAQNVDAQNLLEDSVKLLENELKKVDVKVGEQIIKQENVGDIKDGIEHWKSANDSKILSEKEKLHFSQFSDERPESLNSKNTIAWTDKNGQVVYNKSYIENNFGVKITGNQGETLFDGISLKDYMTKNPGKGEKLINELKILKGHEVAHRLLEINGIKNVNVELKNGTTRIFSQEEICNVIDGSAKISQEERILLEQFFKNKFGEDFKNKFGKDFNLDGKSVRKLDAENISKKESKEFVREREVAKDSNLLNQLSQQIENANSFDELIAIVSRQYKIGGHDSKYMSNMIKMFRTGEFDESYITSTAGLREKALFLRIEMFKKANSLDELIKIIGKQEQVGKQHGKYIANTLAKFKKGEKIVDDEGILRNAEEFLTNKYGIREKAISLKNSEKNNGVDLKNHSTEVKENISKINGKEKLDKIFSDNIFNPDKLIKLLDEWYPGLMNKDVGLKEKYTLGEHTSMVMNQFEKYFGKSDLPLNTNKNLFRFILALHDIGKVDAVIKGNKGLQHKFSQDYIEKLFNALDIDKKHINLATALISDDPIGKYLRGLSNISETKNIISEMSKKAGIPENDFFELLTIYYKSDASSYAKKFGGKNSDMDVLFDLNNKNSLDFSSDIKNKLDNLGFSNKDNSLNPNFNGENIIKKSNGSILEGKFEKGELIKGTITSKNGEIYFYDKNSKNPLILEKDYNAISKINEGNSIKGEIPKMKWTHRTTLDALDSILKSGKMGSNSTRGINFWGGLGTGYGDITLVMKNEISKIPPASEIPGHKVKGQPNMTYFFEEKAKGNGMNFEEYSKNFGDFTSERIKQGDNPNINAPYIMGGEKGSKFNYEVDSNMIESVMLPEHAKSYPNYNEIKKELEQRGIKIIEINTSQNILDYAGGSILNVVNGGKNSKGFYGKQIIQELTKRYPNMNLKDSAIQYLKDKNMIPSGTTKTFEEYLRDSNQIAVNNGLSRGGIVGGQFENYVSTINHNREQKSYFKYLIESKYQNILEMTQKETVELLKGYILMPELLKQKGIPEEDILKIISNIENNNLSFDVIEKRNEIFKKIIS